MAAKGHWSLDILAASFSGMRIREQPSNSLLGSMSDYMTKRQDLGE